MKGILLCLLVLCLPTASWAGAGYSQRDEVRQFVAEMVERHGFKRRELNALFGRARYQPAIIRAMTLPPEAPLRAWQNY
ncbi:MAG: lytic murein transglycosylase B, partial [Betaproteobacteria bacterium]|nr:lytic murein transglycosylase B [Betaproteobacteria bacterium]